MNEKARLALDVRYAMSEASLHDLPQKPDGNAMLKRICRYNLVSAIAFAGVENLMILGII